jgi:CheY-like chemotaxis protein
MTTPSSASTLTGARILLIEDEPETRKVLLILLEQAGAKVVAVESAPLAFDAYISSPPDLILGDIGLPGEDGCALLQRIREHEKNAGVPAVTAVALSAFTRDEDRIRAIQAGFQRHLGKPIDPEHLIDALCSLIK